jgi:multidrug efflux pump subunit AcrB
MQTINARPPPNTGWATLFFLNTHLLVLSIIIILAAGTAALLNLPRIEDPRITNRNPTIVTTLPGASARRVEARITEKLEEKLQEISEIKDLESTSRTGISVIKLELADAITQDTNEAVFSKIRDKLGEAELPHEAGKPVFDDKRGAVAFSMITALQWRHHSKAQLGWLNRLAEQLADRLRNIPGTEVVRIYGEPEEEITVTVDQDQLSAIGLSIPQTARLITAADAKNPAGIVRETDHDLLLEVSGELKTVDRIAAIPVARKDHYGLLRLGDIAQIQRNWRDPATEIAIADGARSILVAARTEPGVQLSTWAHNARSIINEFSAQLDHRINAKVSFDQSHYTQQRLGDLSTNLLAGAAIVILVVLLFMGWRAALIVGSALPLSAAATLFGFSLFAIPIHQMSIFGMIIAIGLLIDNAIVMTDEVSKQKATGKQGTAAVSKAINLLFKPLFASTLTTILAFMPIFLLPGNVGDFVSSIASSVVLALIVSFIVSMTIIPALAAHFINSENQQPGTHWWRHGMHFSNATQAYRKILLFAVQRPKRSLLLVSLLPLLGFGLSTTLGQQFFPAADRDQFQIQLWLPSGTSINRTSRIARDIEQHIQQYPEVSSMAWLVGASFPSVYYNLIMDEDKNASYAHSIVVTKTVAAANVLIPRLQKELDNKFPEAQIVVGKFGQGPPVDAPVGLRIIGPNLEQLLRYGEQIRRVMQSLPGIIHTQASIQGGEAKLWFDVDEVSARLSGLSLNDIAAQLQANLEGQTGSSVIEDIEELPVRIRYHNEQRRSLSNITAFKLVSEELSATRKWLPAEAIGNFKLRPELTGITHFNGERSNNILGYTRPGVLTLDVTRKILSRLDAEGLRMAPGYRLLVAGDSEEQQRAMGGLKTFLPVLLLLMVATLVLSFRSFILAGFIGLVALSSIGLGMLALWISQFPIGFNPILGTLGLVGIAINGSIVVLAAIRANVKARLGNIPAIVEETIRSTRHIISTTLTTVAGFIPLLLFSGGDFWPPLAVVIAGGVAFSVTLSLLFTPALYVLVYHQHRPIVTQPELPGFNVPS